MQSDRLLRRFHEATFAEKLEEVMRWLELVTAGVLVVLFGVGVFDFGLSIVELARTGRITEAREVVGLIDTALLLFIEIARRIPHPEIFDLVGMPIFDWLQSQIEDLRTILEVGEEADTR
ncbi:hypothetical protein ACEU6E_03635 [Halorutilales archaeon Cl-col2-1]